MSVHALYPNRRGARHNIAVPDGPGNVLVTRGLAPHLTLLWECGDRVVWAALTDNWSTIARFTNWKRDA